MSFDNLESLKAMRLGSGHPLEFIIAVPGRRYSEFAELLEGFHAQECVDPEKESIGEREWQDLRLIIAHDPTRAKEQHEKRQQSIDELTKMADEWGPASLIRRMKGRHSAAGSFLTAVPKRGSIMPSATRIWLASSGLI